METARDAKSFTWRKENMPLTADKAKSPNGSGPKTKTDTEATETGEAPSSVKASGQALPYRNAPAGMLRPEVPTNDPIRSFEAGSDATRGLQGCLDDLFSQRFELPAIIGGQRVHTDKTFEGVLPHDHHHVLATVHAAGASEVRAAIDAAAEAATSWSSMPWEERVTVFLRAANLAAGSWRDNLVAATMLGQSKTAAEAEGDIAELVDFFRFNVAAMLDMFEHQPISTTTALNRVDYRPLEGFVFAVTPFNFTSIAGNLPCAPALLGNTVVWKPASVATLPAHFIMCLLEEAGLPAGVINLFYGRGADIGPTVLQDRNLAGIHFTGSTSTFQEMWSEVGTNIARYRSYPRLVGETGGKGFVLVHPSADTRQVVNALLAGAFGYQGQKCSAATRLYVPGAMWPEIRERLEAGIDQLVVGDVRDFATDLGAVIDAAAFERHSVAIAGAGTEPDTRVVIGGSVDAETGYFVHPTVVETGDINCRLLREELFGPILTVHSYRDGAFDDIVDVVDRTSPYALTGAVFATDRGALSGALARLRYAAGNVYANEKPTGAVVGQQPFGGARASGTNDKAGTVWNLIRWSSPRTIKDRLA